MDPINSAPTDTTIVAETNQRNPESVGAGKVIFITIAFYLAQAVVGFVVGIIAVVYNTAAGGRLTPTMTPQIQRSLMPLAAMLGLVAGGLAVLLLTRRMLRRSGLQGGLASLGWRSARSREVAVGLCAGVALAGFYLFLLVRIFPPASGQKWGPMATAAAIGGWQRALWAITALLAPPIEEFVFRGVLWSGLRRSFGATVAGLLVTALFVCSHAMEALSYWPAWLSIAALGVTTVSLRAQTGSLVPPLAVHAAYNVCLVWTVYFVAT